MANQPKRKAEKMSFPKKGKLAKKAKQHIEPQKKGMLENKSATLRNVAVIGYYLLKICNWFKEYWFKES